MVSEDFEVGDPVWAKMKGYPPWPAKIADPPSDVKPPKNKKAHYVFFFGAGNYAWILDEFISPHSENMLNTLTKKKSAAYQTGINELVSYSKSLLKKGKQGTPNDKNVAEDVTKPQTKVVKVLNSVPQKHERKVLSKKSSLKKSHRKRSLDEINGDSTVCPPSKSLKVTDDSPDTLSSKSGVPCYNLHRNKNRNNRVPFRNVKHVQPSNLRFGFIGLGLMGRQVVKTLIQSGHNITVWNKTQSECEIFMRMGAKKVRYPSDLIISCDVTFCCVSDPVASKAVIFGDNGVLKGLEQAHMLGLIKRGYVEMTHFDPDTSQSIHEAVVMKRGVYLEAPPIGTSKDAEVGDLLIIATGDRKLFSKCETCFHAIGKNVYFLTCDVGQGSRTSLIISSFSGSSCAILAEGMVLVERLKLEKNHFEHYLKNSSINTKKILKKARKMKNLEFTKETALKHIQKDIGLCLSLANEGSQPMPVTVAANELYKHGRLSHYSNEDMTAVYKVVKY